MSLNSAGAYMQPSSGHIDRVRDRSALQVAQGSGEGNKHVDLLHRHSGSKFPFQWRFAAPALWISSQPSGIHKYEGSSMKGLVSAGAIEQDNARTH